jgi:hypothetical protein
MYEKVQQSKISSAKITESDTSQQHNCLTGHLWCTNKLVNNMKPLEDWSHSVSHKQKQLNIHNSNAMSMCEEYEVKLNQISVKSQNSSIQSADESIQHYSSETS